MPTLNLLPRPKSVVFKPGAWSLPEQAGVIVLEDSAAARDWFAGDRLARQLEQATQTAWKLVRLGAGETEHKVKGSTSGVIWCRQDDTVGGKYGQGYGLTIGTKGVEIRAQTACGMFYGMQTLAQIARQASEQGGKWPGLVIKDEPDFERRGVYHDVSRGKVPELGTILQLVEDLANLKINEFQLYVENVFEFRRHPEMYDDTTPLTAEELLIIDEACRLRHIDFIPSITSLGHFEKILNRPAFRKLAEAEPEELRQQGIETWSKEPWSLCVTDPKAKAFLKDMYDEFLPNFTSKTVNICCDESWDLGKGRSRELAAKIGTDQLYVNWIKYCTSLAARHGKRIMMWGDIIRNHPEKLSQLPKNAVMIEWGYEWNHDFAGRGTVFAKSGKRFYMAPGTSGWQTLAGRTQNALGNIHAAAAAGKKHGAAGLLNTDWGDNGHQQLLSISLVPFAYGAEVGWQAPRKPLTKDGPVPELAAFLRATSLNLFGDKTGKIAQLAYELGMTYRRLGFIRFNAATEFFLFREAWDNTHDMAKVKAPALIKTRAAILKLADQISQLELTHPDSKLIIHELVFTALLLVHVIERTLVRQKILGVNKEKVPAKKLKQLAWEAEYLGDIYAQLWLARNKQSRLEDVTKEFTRLAKEYRAALKK